MRASLIGFFVGPTAEVFHSSPAWSATETKVGSPPMLSRTSPASSLRSTSAPSASIASHCASLYGLVTRGSSCTRVTDMLTSNVVSALLTPPSMGGAPVASALVARGMCPSPHMSPLVASSPTHPAPGR